MRTVDVDGVHIAVEEITPNDARFMMLSASMGAMLLVGNVTKFVEMREHLLKFYARSGYTFEETGRVIARMRRLVEAANAVDPAGVGQSSDTEFPDRPLRLDDR